MQSAQLSTGLRRFALGLASEFSTELRRFALIIKGIINLSTLFLTLPNSNPGPNPTPHWEGHGGTAGSPPSGNGWRLGLGSGFKLGFVPSPTRGLWFISLDVK